MKSAKLLIITSIFSFLLAACGMKGPLYHAPVSETTEAPKDSQSTAQDSPKDSSENELENKPNNTTKEQ